MIANLVRELGAWSWLILGVALLLAEIMVPGNLLVWVGLAGLVTGVLSLALWETSWWVWEVQWLLFAVLSAVAVIAGRRWLRSTAGSDQPLLNQTASSLVGRTGSLIDPIANGRGRVRIGDTTWIVTGPDLPEGAAVRIVGSQDGALRVEAA